MADPRPTTPALLGARFIHAASTQKITLHRPGQTRRSPHRVITGVLLGEMHMRGEIHHYRVAGDDGVLYLAPPSWVAPECRVEVSNACITARLADPNPASKRGQILALVREMAALLDARDAQRASAPVCQVVPVGWMNLPDSHPMFKDAQQPEGAA